MSAPLNKRRAVNSTDAYARIHDPLGQVSTPQAIALIAVLGVLYVVVGVPLRIIDALRKRIGKRSVR